MVHAKLVRSTANIVVFLVDRNGVMSLENKWLRSLTQKQTYVLQFRRLIFVLVMTPLVQQGGKVSVYKTSRRQNFPTCKTVRPNWCWTCYAQLNVISILCVINGSGEGGQGCGLFWPEQAVYLCGRGSLQAGATLTLSLSLFADESPNVRSKFTKSRHCLTPNLHCRHQPTICSMLSGSCRYRSESGVAVGARTGWFGSSYGQRRRSRDLAQSGRGWCGHTECEKNGRPVRRAARRCSHN